jgi:hypothetical protein
MSMQKEIKPRGVKHLLHMARTLLAKKGKWTQGSFVDTDENAKPVAFCALGAVRFCVFGDAHKDRQWGKKHKNAIYRKALKRLNDAAGEAPDYDIVTFNDDYAVEQSEILAAFDRAIAGKKGPKEEDNG